MYLPRMLATGGLAFLLGLGGCSKSKFLKVDLNADGVPDRVEVVDYGVTDSAWRGVEVSLGVEQNGTVTYTKPRAVVETSRPLYASVADVDDSGSLDIIVGYEVAERGIHSEIYFVRKKVVAYGDGTGYFGEPRPYPPE